jgi:electron transfer flavoprotein alpha subunit
MKKLEPDYSRKPNIIKHPVEITEDDISLNIIKTETGTGDVNFDADIVISGGKGMQTKDSYMSLLDSLCSAASDKLGVSVEKGASRAAVEQGFVDRIFQVGQTGTAIGPNIYIALGISGAIQHMIGVANAQTIIAVNIDHNAPIFKQCDYYLIGDVAQVVPELINALNEVK